MDFVFSSSPLQTSTLPIRPLSAHLSTSGASPTAEVSEESRSRTPLSFTSHSFYNKLKTFSTRSRQTTPEPVIRDHGDSGIRFLPDSANQPAYSRAEGTGKQCMCSILIIAFRRLIEQNRDRNVCTIGVVDCIFYEYFMGSHLVSVLWSACTGVNDTLPS